MDTLTLPPPGTIGLVPIGGETGKLIHLGQYLAENPMSKWMRDNDLPGFDHSFMYLGNGLIIEGEPGGARIVPVAKYSDAFWCTAIASQFTQGELCAVAEHARHYEGTKYSFVDYGALAAHRLHVPVPFLREYIAWTGHLICSQLCDAAYRDEGLQIFKDERWTGYVMPIDFYLRELVIRRERLA